MSGAFGTNWLDLSSTSNRYIQTYYKGFVDISGGPLYVRNNSLYVQGGDVSLNGRLYSAGDASFGNRVFITGNLNVSGNITGTYPNSSIPSSAIIGGVGGGGGSSSSNFTTDVSINQRLIVLGDTSLNSRLYVKNDTTLTGNVTLNNGLSFINPTSSNAINSNWTSAGITWDSSASTTYTTFYSYLAFNGNVSDSWASAQTYNASTGAYTGNVTTTVTTAPSTTQAVTGEWLQIQTSSALALNNYTFTTGGAYTQLPKSFFIVGSNDGTTWYAIQSAVMANYPVTTINTLIPTVISANSAVTTAYGISTITTTTYSTYTTNSYTYFRLIAQSSLPSGSGFAQIGEWTPYFTVGNVSNITLNLDSTVSNQLNLSNNLSVGGKLVTVSDASLNSRLFVGSDVSFGGRLFTSRDVTFNSKLNVGYSTITSNSESNISVGPGANCGTGNYNTSLGWNAGGSANNTGNNNVAVGDFTISAITSGYFNSAVGNDSLKLITTGYYNTAVGHSSFYNLTTGYNNTAIGYRAGYSGTSFNNSTAIGCNSVITANNQITLGTSTENVYCPGRFSVVGTVTLPAASISDSALSSNIARLTATQTLTNKTLTSPVISSISNSGTITIPTGTLTLATLTGTETLTNKTLTSPVISSISNSGTITIPSGTDTLATLTGTETLTNKTLTTSGLFTALSDASLNYRLYVGSDVSFGGQLFLSGDASLNGNLSIAKDMTIGGNLYVKTYTTRQTITELSYQLIVAQDLSLNGRLFLSNDASINNRLFVGSDASFNGKLFSSGLFTADGGLSVTGTVTLPAASISDSALSSNIARLTATQTLTNKTLTSPVISSISNSGTITIPTGTLTLATLTGTETLTNKTLTSPVISSISNTGTITIPTGTLTLATLTGTETLTNKTLTTSGLLTANGGATINGNLAISTSKGISGGSVSAVADDLSVYGLNIGAGSFTAASDCTLNGNLAISGLKGISGGSRTTVAQDLNVYGLNVGAGDIIVFDGGVIAIGTTNANYPLYVNATSAGNVSISNAGRLSTGGAASGISTTTASVSIRSSGTIWSENNIFASSDKRIKTDINAINGISALDKLRQLKPVEYYHIDKFDAGTVKKYGFIAQDVKEVIPESISFEKDYIPNIYDAATVIDNSLIVLDTKTTNEFTLSGETITIKLYDYKNQSKTVILDKIINSTSFTIKEPLLDTDLSYNKIFVYGQEVNDFHILSKETIFTVGIGAMKKLDEDLIEANKKIADLQSQLDILVQRLNNANI